MRKSLLVGMGVGALLMYYLDPSWGRRRRAELRSRVDRRARQLEAWREREAETRPAGADRRPRADEHEIDWMGGDSYRARLMQSDRG